LATGLNGFARQSEIWRRAKKVPVVAPDFRKTSGLRGREVYCVSCANPHVRWKSI